MARRMRRMTRGITQMEFRRLRVQLTRHLAEMQRRLEAAVVEARTIRRSIAEASRVEFGAVPGPRFEKSELG
jgi:hypothetical protein